MAVVSKRSRSDVPSGADGLDEAVLRGMYRAMLLTRADRGARPLPLPAGPDPRVVLHGPRQRGRRRRRGLGDGRPGRRLPHPARPRRAHRARHGALAHHRPVPRPHRRPDAGTRRQRPPRRHRARHADDGLAPARDAAGRRRLRARLPRAQRAARRARLARRRRIGARRRARGHEPRRRAPPARRVRARQQRLRLLHAGAPRVRRHAPGRARGRLRLPGRGRRRHRRRRRLPRRAGRRRARARRRRARRCSSS